jgi:hypothetical protein
MKNSIQNLTAGRELDLLVQEKVLKKAFPADRCPTYDQQAKMLIEARQIIMYGLSLIKLAEKFDINLGKGWQNFKEMAKKTGLEYQESEEPK